MKLVVLQENLNQALGVVQRFTAPRGQLPILANILISTGQGRLKLQATNLEMGISYWLGAKVEAEGQITVPARSLSEWVASLPKERVELAADKDKLAIKCAAYKGEFRGMGAAEFPPLPEREPKAMASLGLTEMEEVMAQVAFAAAADEGRPVLTGIRWRWEEDKLELVATDGYRLSVKTLSKIRSTKHEIRNEEEKTLIIPARTMIEAGQIGKALGGVQTRVEIAAVTGGSQVCFDWGDVQVTTRVLAGEFPEIAKVIPQAAETEAVMEAEELTAAVRAAAVFARESANLVRWEIGKAGIMIAANSPQIGENQIKVEAKVKGKGGKIAFNSRYLLEMLGAIKSKELKLEMTGGLNPGVFRMVGDDTWLHIIMPVRVQEGNEH
jgi:DNA polymerase III subunit beta